MLQLLLLLLLLLLLQQDGARSATTAQPLFGCSDQTCQRSHLSGTVLLWSACHW